MKTEKILRDNKELIFDEWLKRVKEEMPEVRNHDSSAIENSLPGLLDALIVAMQKDEYDKVVFHSQKHGLQRASFDEFSLHHIVREYSLIKKVIFDFLDEKTEVAPKDRNLIFDSIDQAVEQSCESFYRRKNTVLVNARKVAEQKADELKIDDKRREEFIYSLSHDLNNPLSNLKGCMDLLERDPEAAQIEDIMNIMSRSMHQAEALVQDFLNMGEVNSDTQLPLRKHKVNLIAEITPELEAYNVSERGDVKLITDHDQLMINVDVNILLRAVNNLVNNALQYGKKGSVVKVFCESEGDNLGIKVHNEGQPIPEEVKARIFDKYYRGDTDKKGWGLGLSFVKKAVEGHGGEISIESDEKKGTTFIIDIPGVVTSASR